MSSCYLTLSPNGTFLLTVDENNRCLFINLHRHVVLHCVKFKYPVNAIQFSPNGNYIAVGAVGVIAKSGNDGKLDEIRGEDSEPPSLGTPERDGEGKKRRDFDGKGVDSGEEKWYLHIHPILNYWPRGQMITKSRYECRRRCGAPMVVISGGGGPGGGHLCLGLGYVWCVD
ncbi:hypothetical protein LWI29_000684 [Acer saccharum]|uniref:Uncharacterized protein n=1 Tax=Acer saccharum TaxID=4024 RepID=A0AA39SKE7_ACESA|nr:hypothetical protein LWI29_000684 [Acer saccharum]